MANKLKIVILCHFTNDEMQEKLPLKIKSREFSPWIVSTIREFESRNEIEVHVVSPHSSLYRNTSFILRNVHYHFFFTGIPFLARKWPKKFLLDYHTNYWLNRLQIKRIVRQISPNLVHLYGAEIDYFASAFLNLLDLPHLVTIQGFLYLSSPDLSNRFIRNRVKIEKAIYSQARNIGIRYPFMQEEIIKLNPNATFYWHHIPANIYIPGKIEKTYELVYFAKLIKTKGIEDFIKIVGLIKKQMPEVKAKILGSVLPEYLQFLKQLAISHNCSENIEFKGFIATQNELHAIVAQAKICILPTYSDMVPGTIIESMFLETAVAAYKTGGIPSLNEIEKTVELSEIGDWVNLADKVITLLNDLQYRLQMVSKARSLAEVKFSPKTAINDLISAYYSISKYK